MESTDQRILALLARDGRISYTEIGRRTGLSTSAAQQRVRRLEQRGVITGYHAELDPAALGRTLTAFISIRAINPEQDEAIPGVLESIPAITSCFSVAGDASFMCVAQVGTTSDLDVLLSQLRSRANVSTVTTVVLTTIFSDRPLVEDPAAEEDLTDQ